jgi:sarcosine oxidase
MQHWFAPREHAELFSPEQLPIALWETSGRMFYTIPDFGDGVKIAVHHDGEITDPQRVRRTISDQEDATARALIERYLPDAAGELRDRAVCLYTNTTDGHFMIDRHPMQPEVVIASPCSGHGFKFATVIGEIVAKLTVNEAVEDLSLFRCRA